MSLIELKDIHKSFYGVEVLHGVNFVLQSGSVHALMGENGAGKSTLMKVIAGVHTADSGKVFLDNKEIEISSPAKARELGIAMIHQELSSELEMSVAENIYLGREPGRFGMVDYRQLYHQTDELLKKGKEFTALFAMSDRMAVGACKAILDHGGKIPDEYSVVGFDGMDVAQYYNPSITTIQQPVEEMAEATIRMLLDLIRKKHKSRHLVFEGQLIEGQSVRNIRENEGGANYESKWNTASSQ